MFYSGQGVRVTFWGREDPAPFPFLRPFDFARGEWNAPPDPDQSESPRILAGHWNDSAVGGKVVEFVMNVVCPPEEGISQVERFAREVMVGFR